MNKIESALINSAVSYVTNYVSHEKKNYVIEPLSCIIRLAILAYKKKGTKISLYDNSIYLQEPGPLQGTLRWITRNNRNDIQFLLSPINKAILKYGKKDDKSEVMHEQLMNIFRLAIKGLQNLKYSYSKHSYGNLTTHSIDLYISNLKQCIKGSVMLSDDDDDDEEDKKTYLSLNSLWTNDQIEIVNDLFLECDKNPKDSSSYLQAIDNIINSKLKPTKEILLRNLNNCL